VVHSVENELVSGALNKGAINLTIIIKFSIYYVENCVSIHKPHDSRLRVADDAARETSNSAFLNDN
jgi:hypothetical protein